MEIKRSGSQPSSKGPADWFTGTVRIDPLFQVHAPARAAGASVTLSPRPDGVAHPPAGADPDHHGRLRLGPAGGRPGRGSPSRRRGLVPAGREALARCHADHGHDAYRHPGAARRQGRRLAGARERRTVPQVIVRPGQALSAVGGKRRTAGGPIRDLAHIVQHVTTSPNRSPPVRVNLVDCVHLPRRGGRPPGWLRSCRRIPAFFGSEPGTGAGTCSRLPRRIGPVRWSNALIPTLKETPADAVAPSHVLLIRAGMIRQLGAGAYTYLPLGLRVLHKASQIVRQEMDAAGAIELLCRRFSPSRSGRSRAGSRPLATCS